MFASDGQVENQTKDEKDVRVRVIKRIQRLQNSDKSKHRSEITLKKLPQSNKTGPSKGVV